MIDAKHAAAAATTYFRGLFGDDGITDILLEEIELTEDERFWLVTLSALIPVAKEDITPLAALLNPSTTRRRIYRLFTVKADTGTVHSMKMRPI